MIEVTRIYRSTYHSAVGATHGKQKQQVLWINPDRIGWFKGSTNFPGGTAVAIGQNTFDLTCGPIELDQKIKEAQQ